MHTAIAASTGWTLGIVLGVVVILIAAAIVITIVHARAADRRAGEHRRGRRRRRCGSRRTQLNDIGRINDSGVRILHAARALRKVAVGK